MTKVQRKRFFFGIVLFFMISGIIVTTYNEMVTRDEMIKNAYAQIETNMQRELDLLPNLIKVVQKYAQYEERVLKDITALRADASKHLKAQTPTEQKEIKELSKIDKALKSSTTQLFMVAENYPQLKASENFLELQSQIEGAQNRINIARMRYNDAVRDFNAYIRTFPANIMAKMAGYGKQEYFHADEKAHQAFKVEM
jgi:LemA protein